MSRSSMADLIGRLRTMTGDTGTPPVFEDDDLQAVLDERRTDVVEAALRYRPSFDESSLVIFHDFFAPWRYWEDSVVLRGPTGAVLTPDTADLTAAHWTFDDGQAIPVWITGSRYDLEGSAAVVKEQWAALDATRFDFVFAGQEYFRSQVYKAHLAVARSFWGRAFKPARPAWRSMDW